jgi:hypothetical protein
MKDFPYPLNDGCRADVCRIQAMNRLGYSIHALRRNLGASDK